MQRTGESGLEFFIDHRARPPLIMTLAVNRPLVDMPFEFCALRYLLQWERKEKGLHARMRKTLGVPDIRISLQYFQVARNFAGLKKDSRAQSIVDLLASVDSRDDHTPFEKVDLLATRFKSKFEQFNLSAASKLLWLKHKRPYAKFWLEPTIELAQNGGITPREINEALRVSIPRQSRGL